MITMKIIIKSKNSMENLINSLEGVLELAQDSTIKVMGVGGGGCNAVNYLYHQGVPDVTFLVCNTDKQSLERSSVPAKLQLGPGLGAGGKPEVAQEYAEQNRERIKEALNDGTKMLFLTAGMGGGTGTGAAPYIAKLAKEMDILIVAVVTKPFEFEGRIRAANAELGIKNLSKCVDTLVVIPNDRLLQVVPKGTPVVDAFKYGTPPHAGLALGLDRVVALLAKTNSIRDVIAFPKNAAARCPMSEAPSKVDVSQLDELHIKIVE